MIPFYLNYFPRSYVESSHTRALGLKSWIFGEDTPYVSKHSTAIRKMKVRTMRYHLKPARKAIPQKTNNYKCWWWWGEIGTLIHYWWRVKWCSHFWNSLTVPQKVKYRAAIWPSNSTARYTTKTKNKCLHKNLHRSVIAALFIIDIKWKQFKYPSVDD